MISLYNELGMHDRRMLDSDLGSGVNPECFGARIQEVRIFHRTNVEPDDDEGHAADVFPDQ